MRAHVLASVSSGVSLVVAMGWDRLTLALACVASITILAATGKVDGTAAVGIISALVGYVVGAGHESVRRDKP